MQSIVDALRASDVARRENTAQSACLHVDARHPLARLGAHKGASAGVVPVVPVFDFVGDGVDLAHGWCSLVGALNVHWQWGFTGRGCD